MIGLIRGREGRRNVRRMPPRETGARAASRREAGTRLRPVSGCRFLAAGVIIFGSWLTASAAAAQYLAVFVDGRVLPVMGASLLNERTIRLELSDEGRLEIPATRLEAVVEAFVEPDEAPLPQPCTAGWEDHPLPKGTPFAGEIEAAARAAGLHPWLVAAMVEAESRFDPRAVSRVGARGLMQLMPAVWVPAGLANPHEVAGNLRVGAAYLKYLNERFGDLALALAAYNAGPTTVERLGGVPPYRETRDFVRRILSRFCPEEVSEGL